MACKKKDMLSEAVACLLILFGQRPTEIKNIDFWVNWISNRRIKKKQIVNLKKIMRSKSREGYVRSVQVIVTIQYNMICNRDRKNRRAENLISLVIANLLVFSGEKTINIETIYKWAKWISKPGFWHEKHPVIFDQLSRQNKLTFLNSVKELITCHCLDIQTRLGVKISLVQNKS